MNEQEQNKARRDPVVEEIINICDFVAKHGKPLFPGDTLSHATADTCVERGWAARDGEGNLAPTLEGWREAFNGVLADLRRSKLPEGWRLYTELDGYKITVGLVEQGPRLLIESKTTKNHILCQGNSIERLVEIAEQARRGPPGATIEGIATKVARARGDDEEGVQKAARAARDVIEGRVVI